MPKRILVLGGTGLLGEPVARGLHAAGYAVQVLSRDGPRAEAMLSDIAEIAVGDALRSADVQRALTGCDAVHISIDNECEHECVVRIVRAAKARNIERITYVSGTTVCEANRWFPLVDRKWRSEEAIRASGIPYTVFCPGWFMEMLARFVRGNRAVLFGTPVRRWHFVAVGEFARMVVDSYARPEAANRRFYVHGPEALTVAEALEMYCRVLHPHIRTVHHLAPGLAGFLARISRNVELRRGVELTSYLERVGESGDPATANALFGAPRLTLAGWLQVQRPSAAAGAARTGVG